MSRWKTVWQALVIIIVAAVVGACIALVIYYKLRRVWFFLSY